jgi:hypothetical protein
MATLSSTASLPSALTVAHRKLWSLLNEAIRQFKRSLQYSNGVEICSAVEGFLGEFSHVPGGDEELQRRAYFTMRKCGEKSDLERARVAAWGVYSKNRQPPSGQNRPEVRLYISNLRKTGLPPLCLGDVKGNGVVGTRWTLEQLIELDVLEPKTRTAFLRWLRECKKVEDAAEGLEVDGCAWLLGILPRVTKVAVAQSRGKSATMREIIRSNDFGVGMLKPMRAAADCLMRWVKEHLSQNRGLAAALAGGGTPGTAPVVENQGGGVDQTPKIYLTNWRDILVALGHKGSNKEDRERVRNLNTQYGGPIIFPGQGAQPKVDKAKLIEWWNGLEAQWEVGFNRERDVMPTVSDQHSYGKAGTVVPGISGGVKKRRKDQKA